MHSSKIHVAGQKSAVFFMLLFGLFLPGVSGADEVIVTGVTNTATIAGYGHADRLESAQSFTTTVGGYAQTISVWMNNTNGVADDATLSLMEDSGGEPTGTQLDTTSIDVVGTGCTEYIWTLDETTSLSPATTYWILFGRTGGADDYDYGLCGDEPSAYAGGTEADKDSGIWADKDRDAYAEITLVGTPSGGGTSTTATTTELTTIHNDLLWMLWLVSFICSFLWFERYYKT